MKPPCPMQRLKCLPPAPIESEKFLSMPKELARKYEEKFKYPERFYKSLDGIEAKPYKPVSKDMER